MNVTRFKIDKEAAKNETWFHPTKGRTVCIADIADTMTDTEAEIFFKGGCKAITEIEANDTIATMATPAENTDASAEVAKQKKK